LLDNQQYRLENLNKRLCRIFGKIDKVGRGYITKSQIQYNFPREEKEEVLKYKILNSLSECPNGTYLDLVGFLSLVHFIINLGIYHTK